MKYVEYNPNMQKGGCILRSFMKLFDKEESVLEKELLDLAKSMNHDSYTDVEIFEKNIDNNNYKKIDSNNILVKDLKNFDGKYACFCFKNDWYHMLPIIDNTVYDKSNDSLELYVINLYKLENR